ncbi:MAG: phosphonate transport system substrate-binding [Geobacteraceae bacterium]|nr:MAG: phosphonate transport system substrate-binding [Geobacteraceae bacterium]
MKSVSGKICSILVFLLIPLSTFAQSPQQQIVIGLIPELNVFKQMERFSPLAAYLTDKTGIKVKFTILSRYGNMVERFSKERLDAAFFGSFTGALAIRKLGVVPLARPVNLDGESTYHAHLYTRKDSGIKSIADMKGKKIAFVDKATTAGYVFPVAYFKEHGITNIDKFFGETFYAGSHDASLYAVLNREADIGASKNSVYDIIRSSDPRIDEEIVIVAESSKVPSNGLCVRKGLHPQIANKLKEALLNLDKNPEYKSVLEKLKFIKFIPTTVDDYKPVFEMTHKAGIDLRKYDYRNE